MRSQPVRFMRLTCTARSAIQVPSVSVRDLGFSAFRHLQRTIRLLELQLDRELFTPCYSTYSTGYSTATVRMQNRRAERECEWRPCNPNQSVSQSVSQSSLVRMMMVCENRTGRPRIEGNAVVKEGKCSIVEEQRVHAPPLFMP